jgi:hypothetical protein
MQTVGARQPLDDGEAQLRVQRLSVLLFLSRGKDLQQVLCSVSVAHVLDANGVHFATQWVHHHDVLDIPAQVVGELDRCEALAIEIRDDGQGTCGSHV